MTVSRHSLEEVEMTAAAAQREKAARYYLAGQREWQDRPEKEDRSRSRADEENNCIVLSGPC